MYGERRPLLSLTNDLALECLVVLDGLVIALAFTGMVFTIEILDRLVVE